MQPAVDPTVMVAALKREMQVNFLHFDELMRKRTNLVEKLGALGVDALAEDFDLEEPEAPFSTPYVPSPYRAGAALGF